MVKRRRKFVEKYVGKVVKKLLASKFSDAAKSVKKLSDASIKYRPHWQRLPDWAKTW